MARLSVPSPWIGCLGGCFLTQVGGKSGRPVFVTPKAVACGVATATACGRRALISRTKCPASFASKYRIGPVGRQAAYRIDVAMEFRQLHRKRPLPHLSESIARRKNRDSTHLNQTRGFDLWNDGNLSWTDEFILSPVDSSLEDLAAIAIVFGVINLYWIRSSLYKAQFLPG
jgi:hypothetical protein